MSSFVGKSSGSRGNLVLFFLAMAVRKLAVLPIVTEKPYSTYGLSGTFCRSPGATFRRIDSKAPRRAESPAWSERVSPFGHGEQSRVANLSVTTPAVHRRLPPTEPQGPPRETPYRPPTPPYRPDASQCSLTLRADPPGPCGGRFWQEASRSMAYPPSDKAKRIPPSAVSRARLAVGSRPTPARQGARGDPALVLCEILNALLNLGASPKPVREGG